MLEASQQFNSTTTAASKNDHKVEQHLWNSSNLHEGKIYCSTIVLGCISLG